MNELETITTEYRELLFRHRVEVSDQDYEWFQSQIPFLQKFSQLDNSAISVFDLHQKKHLFASENFNQLFDIPAEEAIAETSIDNYVHPDDRILLMSLGVKSLRLYNSLPMNEKTDYKLVNEFRLLTRGGKYVRVIEQHKVFKTDKNGNVWLALSIVDVSPNQNQQNTVLSQMVNTRNGKSFSLLDPNDEKLKKLSSREREVLRLAGKGLLSKEISDMLSISVHTVNTHRQRILKKMNANNTVEAVDTAKRFGLV